MGVILTTPRPSHGALNWDTALESDLAALASAINVPMIFGTGAGQVGHSELNGLTSSGIYYGSSLSNAPGGSTHGFVVLDIRRDANTEAQIAIDIQANTMFYRAKFSGVFAPWKTVTAT